MDIKDQEIANLKDKLLSLHEKNAELQNSVLESYKKLNSDQPSSHNDSINLNSYYLKTIDFLRKDGAVHKCGHRGVLLLQYVAYKCEQLGQKVVSIDGQEFSDAVCLISNDAIGINRNKCVAAGYLKVTQEHRNRPSFYELTIEC